MPPAARSEPDPEELAARLFDRELNGHWDVFYGAAATHASILGERRLAVYRLLADEEWKKIKSLGPSKAERVSSHNPFNITHIMESLAEVSGDVSASPHATASKAAFNFASMNRPMGSSWGLPTTCMATVGLITEITGTGHLSRKLGSKDIHHFHDGGLLEQILGLLHQG